MGQPLEVHIRRLQEFYWSDADPDGRGFVPLADALRRAGDLREAHRLLREGLNRHPDYLSGHVVSAWLSLDRGDVGEAESRFRSVLEEDPGNVAALRGMSDLLLEKGATEEALEYLETLSREDPVDGTLRGLIAELKGLVEAPDGGDLTVEDIELPIWDNLEAVAEELNWEEASLQPDSGRYGEPEDGGGGRESGEAEENGETEAAGAAEVAEEPGAADEPEAEADEKPGSAEARELEGGPPLVVEDREPIPETVGSQGALLTYTLGEIYLRQGLLDRAEEVFRTLLEKDPENEDLQERLEEASSLMRSVGSDAARDQGAVAEEGELQDLAATVLEVPDEGSWQGEAGIEVVSIESLAPDRFLASRADEPVPIPPPAEEDAIPIDALAPEDTISIDALAPEDAVSIDALAPDEPVAVEALAPDDAVPIENLAPEDAISIDALAPEVESGSVERSEGMPGEPEEDSTLEAFERWLEDL